MLLGRLRRRWRGVPVRRRPAERAGRRLWRAGRALAAGAHRVTRRVHQLVEPEGGEPVERLPAEAAVDGGGGGGGGGSGRFGGRPQSALQTAQLGGGGGRLLRARRTVHGQRARLAEALVADVALERFLLHVDVLVVPEVVLPPEGLAADVTREGPLVRVRPLVDQQVVALAELALAVLADVALLGPGGLLAEQLWSEQRLAEVAEQLRVQQQLRLPGGSQQLRRQVEAGQLARMHVEARWRRNGSGVAHGRLGRARGGV